MTAAPASGDERVLIVAPIGVDAQNMHDVLCRAGLAPNICPNLSAAAIELGRGCGAVLMTEEAFEYPRSGDLADAVSRQPAWSDLPLVLIVSGSHRGESKPAALQLMRTQTNFILVERPLRKDTLVSTVESALRARRRQYQVRELLRERDELLASLEQRVADRTAKLLELNTELETFSYSVSHDLRAPLRSVETYARVLCEDYSQHLPDEAKNYLQRITKNAQRMDRLMQDVLTFSRIARADVSIVALDLDTILAGVIDQYADLAAAHEVINLRSPLGVVLGHEPGLIQCFSNLLQNALKFAKPGVQPRIDVFSEKRGARLRVYVKDNGIGIEPAFQTRIFGLFERASPAAVPGTGVGLAIVKKAAERMGGSVGVTSEAGQGSCFWIELPAADTTTSSRSADLLAHARA